jgi:cytochrome b6-f complex iron-sulfur subunit
METSTVLLIAIPVLVALAALALYTTSQRRDRAGATGTLARETRKKDRGVPEFLEEDEAATGRDVEREAVLARRGGGTGTAVVRADAPPAPVAYVPPDPETVGVSRRQFFNRSIVAMFGLGLGTFGAGVLAFLWPRVGEGFGATITVGRVDNILQTIRDNREPFYVSEGRFYINPFPTGAVAAAEGIYSPATLPGLEAGVVAIYQRCPHLGCRVPWCGTSQWFECGCHGSQYSRVGEYRGGPAPRGMDLFPVTVSGGVVSVDTGTVVEGTPIGTNTTGQDAEGPNCIDAGAGDH